MFGIRQFHFNFEPDKKTFSVLLVSWIAIILQACSPRFTNVDMPITDIKDFSESGQEILDEAWWTAFEDKQLNDIIDSALQNNFDLAATWQQFLSADAVVAREASSKWPQVELSAQTARNRPEPDFAGGENTQLGVSASYEIDLWGRIRTGVQAEKLRAEASLLDYQTAAISLSAEIASVWYQIAAAKSQLRLAEDQISTNEDIMQLIRARFGSGQIRAVDILRQTQLLESTREQKIIFETQVSLLENQLAVLLGHQPQGFRGAEINDLPALPALPDAGLPLELLRRRPDIRQAHTLLLAADRDLASAVRAKYPRLSVGGRGQLRSNNFENLFRNWAYSITGNLLAPLFYGGQLSAEVNRNEAVKQQRLYEYGQEVLVAFREVEDALLQEEQQQKRLLVIERQLDLALKTNAQLRIEFLNGLSPYLDILLSLDQEQQLRRDLTSARSDQIQIRIGLYRALAGGFETGRNLDP